MNIEGIRKKYPFTYSAPIKWGEMDALGHLNNTVYFRFSEEARIHLFRDLSVLTNPDAGTGPILAYIDCQFYSPVIFPDTLIVGTWIEHIGRTSFQIMHHYYSLGQDRLVGQTKSIVVMVNYDGSGKVPIPEELRDQLLTRQGGFDLSSLSENSLS